MATSQATSQTNSRKIAFNIFFLGSSQLITWILASIYVLIIPRYLGPEAYGILALMGAVSSVLSVVTNLGTRVFILREIAREPEKANVYVVPAIIFNTVFTALAWLVALLFLNIINASEINKQVLQLTAISSTLLAMISPLQASLQGMDKMHYSFFEAVLQKGLNTVIAITLAALGFGLILVVITDLITTLPVVILYGYWFFKHSKIKHQHSLSVYKSMLRGGLSFYIADISFNIYLYMDAILLSALASEEAVGFYNVPTRLFGTLLIIPSIVGRAVLPTLSRLAISSNVDFYKMSRQFIAILMCLSFPVAVGNTVMAGPIINFFYQSQFAPSIPIMIILGWTVVPTYFGMGLYQILTAQNRQGRWSIAMTMAIFVNGILNGALIPIFQGGFNNGGVGAALGLFLTEMVIGIYGFGIAGSELFNSQLIGNLVRSLFAALVMGILIWPFREAPLLIPIFAGIIIYGLAIISLNLVSENNLRDAISIILRITRKFRRVTGPVMNSERFFPVINEHITEEYSFKTRFKEDVAVWLKYFKPGWQPEHGIKLRDSARVVYLYPGLRATLLYRLSHHCWRKQIPLLPGFLNRLNVTLHGFDVPCTVDTGPGLYVPHPVGTVIMAEKIGSHISLISGITIGMRVEPGFPTIGNNVYIGVGARLLGKITVGNNVNIGAMQ